jgi:uncharacterized protein
MATENYRVKIIKQVEVPMRDGVNLGAFRVSPDEPGKKFPAIVEMNPYRKDDAPYTKEILRSQYLFAENGYHVLRADIRGVGASEGNSVEMWHPVERKDAYDLVEWVASQPWCDGNVGMWGSSYGGNTSYYAAAEGAPHLKAIIPMHCADDTYLAQYRGGCLRPFLFLHYAPLMSARNFSPPIPSVSTEKWIEIWDQHVKNNVPWSVAFLQNQTDGSFWKARSLLEYDKIKCATFIIDGWQDWHATAGLNIFQKISCPKKILIGPWSHFGGSQVGNSGPPPDSAVPGPGVDYLRECKKWFDYWLKGIENNVEKEPRVTVFVRKYTQPSTYQIRENGNYRHESEWPLLRSKNRSFFLAPEGDLKGSASQSEVDRVEGYAYNPVVGIMAEPRAGQSEFRTALDQRPDELSSLVFSSEPLDADIEVTGQPRAILYASSTARVTLFCVKLCDVATDGTSVLVTLGKMNATHRNSQVELSPLEPGKIYEIRLDMKACSYVFEKGHRIRVDISSSDFPDAWPTPELCTNSIHISKSNPSQVILPIVENPVNGLPEPDLLVSKLTPFSEEGWKSFVKKPDYNFTQDFINGLASISATKITEEGLDEETQIKCRDVYSMTIPTNDPAKTSTKAFSDYTIVMRDMEIEVSTQTLLLGNSTTYHLLVEVEGRVNQKLHFSRSWNISVPRALN